MELARLVPAGTSRASFTLLPVPCFNVINGGQHAGGNLKVQEFMIIPQKETFAENYRMGAEIYQNLKGILSSQYGVSAINVGYEGGFTPALNKTREALDLILQAIEKAGYLAEVKLGLDVAASEFFENGQYNFEEGTMNSQKMIDFYQGLLEDYPIIYLEDPFSQEDFESWGKLKKVTSSRKNLMIIGDDLLVTNVQRIEMAQKQSLCNALILKPNQIGTVTESLKAVSLAQAYGWKVVASHRSGDTCDDFIADLAVGTGANFMKAGGLSRGERVTKYNRLLEIEEELGEISKYRV
ncbi:MAG: hypothetical protein NTV62_03095 [Candidatus Gribaldobacteria bacterium]|nr:hypothetical protein [Candidatus Gribaldobacteria bacterium]